VTDETVRLNVLDELRLAESALRAAAILLDAGLAPDAASRIYYAAFHASRALLFSAGLEPRSHQAVRSLVARHFVREGALTSERSKHLAHLEAIRSAGDYDSSFALTIEDLRPEFEKADAFVTDVRAILAREKWIS
jgi:uncharacterized protein (UPF0332 family)